MTMNGSGTKFKTPNPKMKILITGGSGYLGSETRKRLGRRFSFINFDIKNDTKHDIRSFPSVKKAVVDINGILHFAAISRPKWGFQDPRLCLTTNINGTFNVLEAVRQMNPAAWIIFASSREVFGNLRKLPAKEESPRHPLNAYGVSKKSGEDLLEQYAKNYGLRCLTLRFCGVYTGKNDILDRVVPRFIGQALRDENITIEGSGKQLGDYVYIDDVINGIEKAVSYISKRRSGFYDAINLVAENPVSLEDLAKSIRRFTKSKSKIVHLPPRHYDQQGFFGSFAKADKVLEWQPRISLKIGLQKSIRELKPFYLSKHFKMAGRSLK